MPVFGEGSGPGVPPILQAGRPSALNCPEFLKITLGTVSDLPADEKLIFPAVVPEVEGTSLSGVLQIVNHWAFWQTCFPELEPLDLKGKASSV